MLFRRKGGRFHRETEENDLIFEKTLMPDRMCGSFRDVTPEMLLGLGVKHILCDIDNTLVTYDDPKPTEELLAWFDSMNRNGIKVGFVSNNEWERVELFNSELGFTAYAKAGKPFTKKLKLAMAEMGAEESTSAFLGDQLLTDAAAANRAGLYSIIVPPIKDKRNAFFRFKRLLEVPYVKKYRKNHSV